MFSCILGDTPNGFQNYFTIVFLYRIVLEINVVFHLNLTESFEF